MVVREAAVMGTPALLIEGSCSAEGVVHNQNGYLCENSVEAIAQAIREALKTAQAVGFAAQNTIPIPWNQLMLTVEARYVALIEKKRKGTGHET
jgi:glycosyltransferase involved in cell wall biosynthesis